MFSVASLVGVRWGFGRRGPAEGRDSEDWSSWRATFHVERTAFAREMAFGHPPSAFRRIARLSGALHLWRDQGRGKRPRCSVPGAILSPWRVMMPAFHCVRASGTQRAMQHTAAIKNIMYNHNWSLFIRFYGWCSPHCVPSPVGVPRLSARNAGCGHGLSRCRYKCRPTSEIAARRVRRKPQPQVAPSVRMKVCGHPGSTAAAWAGRWGERPRLR